MSVEMPPSTATASAALAAAATAFQRDVRGGRRDTAESDTGQAEEMRHVLEEDAHVRQRPLAHEFLVHVGLEGELLHILVLADARHSWI